MPGLVKFRVSISFDVHCPRTVCAAELADMIDKELNLPTFGYVGEAGQEQHVELDCEEVDIRVRYTRRGRLGLPGVSGQAVEQDDDSGDTSGLGED